MTGARRLYLNVAWALVEVPDMSRQRILEALADARADQAHGALPKEVGPLRRELVPGAGQMPVVTTTSLLPKQPVRYSRSEAGASTYRGSHDGPRALTGDEVRQVGNDQAMTTKR
jgi:hypothetical protein